MFRDLLQGDCRITESGIARSARDLIDLGFWGAILTRPSSWQRFAVEVETSLEMRTCSYCGKEYPDTETRCLIDGEPLLGGESQPTTETLPPTITAELPVEPMGDRSLRIIELIFFCFLAVGSSLIYSLTALSGAHQYSGYTRGISYWTSATLQEVAMLGLLWCLLRRRSKSWSDLGLSWVKSDIGWSFLLIIGGAAAYGLIYYPLRSSSLIPGGYSKSAESVGNFLFSGGVFAMTIVFQFVNPFFEELIVRAYLMTEVRQLTNSATKAVILSTALQTGYHFYQGVPMALADGGLFLLFSIYYAKTNRITPVILAHLFFDVSGTLSYAIRHS